MGDIVSAMVISKNKAKLTDNERNWLQSLNISAEANEWCKSLQESKVRQAD